MINQGHSFGTLSLYVTKGKFDEHSIHIQIGN